MPTMSATNSPRKRARSISAKAMRAASTARRRWTKPRAWPRTASSSCRSRVFPTTATERSARVVDQFAKQPSQRLAFGVAQAGKDFMLIGNVGGQGVVDQGETVFGQLHDNAAPVAGVRAAQGQSGLLQ